MHKRIKNSLEFCVNVETSDILSIFSELIMVLADWDDCHIPFIPIMKKSILATLNNLLEYKNSKNKNHTDQPTNHYLVCIQWFDVFKSRSLIYIRQSTANTLYQMQNYEFICDAVIVLEIKINGKKPNFFFAIKILPLP